jgi:hypothetical protein
MGEKRDMTLGLTIWYTMVRKRENIEQTAAEVERKIF